MVDSKTIFQIQNFQDDDSDDFASVDVSFISPYPLEQEIIMNIHGTAILDPRQLLFSECKCSGQLDCSHNVEQCFKKIVIVDLLLTKWLEKERNLLFCSSLKQKVKDFVTQMEQHRGVVLWPKSFFFHGVVVCHDQDLKKN